MLPVVDQINVKNDNKTTVNLIELTTTKTDASEIQVETISRIHSFRVKYICLNLTPASTAHIGLLANTSLHLVSRRFSSLKNNSSTYTMLQTKPIIASYPVNYNFCNTTLVPGRLTWTFDKKNPWIKLETQASINSYDFSLTTDSLPILPLSPGDFWSVCLEIKNYN